jgi:hypothetical protein
MTRIVNLTQHNASPDQRDAGVFEPRSKEFVKRQLTFADLPALDDIHARAEAIAAVAQDASADAAMIGGAPYLMSALERALIGRDITPLYAFSLRESVEETQPDGSTKKSMVFRHQGFVSV